MSGLRLTLGLLPVLLALCGCQSLGHQCAAATAAGVDHSPCAWAGIYPTVVTPFSCDGIDVASLEAQLRHELAGGVHGLLVLGTIGEGEYANEAERAEVIRTAVRVAAGCKPVVAGIHTCDLGVAQSQLHQARQLGAAAVLVKYAGNPRACPGEVLGFMAALSDMKALPIFYYHYPSQTGLKLSARDVADILLLPGVVGIKESTLNLREVEEHLRLTRGHGKCFLSGTALNLTQFMKLGGHGAMCPEAVLRPGSVVQAWEAAQAGRWREARAIQRTLFEMLPILRGRSTSTLMTRTIFMAAQDHRVPLPMGSDHPQARLKYALNCLGVPTPTAVKCPLPPLSSKDKREVRRAVAQLRGMDDCNGLGHVAPVPLHACAAEDEAGILLTTGGIQPGPGAGLAPWGWLGAGAAGP